MPAKLRGTTAALGLYRYGVQAVGGQEIAAFHAAFVESFASVGLTATYIAMDGDGYTGRSTRIGGSGHKKALATGFAGVNVLSLDVNPEGSDEPAYDSFASISMSFVKEKQELLLCFAVDESFTPFASPAYDAIVARLISLSAWSFGYGFKAPARKKPDFHILGLDPGTLTADERKALIAWYSSTGELRSIRLRNVYELNLLSPAQLGQRLPDGRTLREFIDSSAGSLLEQLPGGDLFVWKLKSEADVEAARSQLQATGLLIEFARTR